MFVLNFGNVEKRVFDIEYRLDSVDDYINRISKKIFKEMDELECIEKYKDDFQKEYHKDGRYYIFRPDATINRLIEKFIISGYIKDRLRFYCNSFLEIFRNLDKLENSHELLLENYIRISDIVELIADISETAKYSKGREKISVTEIEEKTFSATDIRGNLASLTNYAEEIRDSIEKTYFLAINNFEQYFNIHKASLTNFQLIFES